jgi:hypothetical protein
MFFYGRTLGWQCYSYPFFSPIAGKIRGGHLTLVTWQWHREWVERPSCLSDGGRPNHPCGGACGVGPDDVVPHMFGFVRQAPFVDVLGDVPQVGAPGRSPPSEP